MDKINQELVNERIIRCLEGIATQEEQELLLDWMNQSAENKLYFQQLKNLWDMSDPKIAELEISSPKALEKVLHKMEPSGSRKLLVTFQKIAAILLLPLVAASFLVAKKIEHKESTSVSYNEIYASIGTRSTILLSDGSKVWLNSGSKLRYPDKFTSSNRVVFLTGEAYFEVQSDVDRPFIVRTHNVNVKATGTKFNVQALKSEREIKVSLLKGKVEVNKQIDTDKNLVLANLVPNQMLTYDTLTGKAQTFSGDLYEFIAWKDGQLVFRNRPLSEVVKKLSQHYNVDIELRGRELQDYRYRATFEEESLNEVLKLLQLSSPIRYMEVKRTLQPDGTFTKRKIIITPQ